MRFNSPANSIQRVAFCVLAGCESVRLEGQDVAGRFKSSLSSLARPKRERLVEEFANWPSGPEDIVRFTKRYGPLEEKPVAGISFRFQVDAWLANQEGFRLLWAIVQDGASAGGWGRFAGSAFEPLVQFDLDGTLRLTVSSDDVWTYPKVGLSYQAATLWRFLIFNLLACPRERLRTCARPECDSRFFVARHLKQSYCTDRCAAWARKQWKLRWWKEHGPKWRARRQNVFKGKKPKHGKSLGR